MNSFSGFNSITAATNSTVTSAVDSAIGAVNSIGTTTIGAVNSLGANTFGMFSNIGTTTVGAINSVGVAAIGAANSAMNAATPFTNANVFTNVKINNSSMNKSANNSYMNKSANNSMNLSANTSKGWSSLFGVTLFLISALLVVMVVFKTQLSLAWTYMVNSLQTMLNMNPPAPQTPDQIAAAKAALLNSPLPTTLDTTYQATQEQTNIVNKILPMGAKEVYNVSTNEYTYYDAEPLCRALGAELATYDQVKTAWNKGADWCNYGWTKGQVAIYPTQKETWDKLQGGPADEHEACGKPGVNGGYFDNPEMRFGVNCYGVKPDQSSNDERILMENGTIPKTVSALKIDQQIQDMKHNTDMVGLLPFNSNKWATT